MDSESASGSRRGMVDWRSRGCGSCRSSSTCAIAASRVAPRQVQHVYNQSGCADDCDQRYGCGFQLCSAVGVPDIDESSEIEDPRPPIVTRILTYQKEHVSAMFRAQIPFGSKEAVNGRWQPMGFTDPRRTLQSHESRLSPALR